MTPADIAVAGSGTRGRSGGALAARIALGVVLALSAVVSVSWLALGAAAAAAQYWPAAGRSIGAGAAAGNVWARAISDAAAASQPLGQAVLDYGFSTLNLVLAVVLLSAETGRTGLRTWPIRLLAVALVGSAGAFNLQAHAAARAVEAATGLAVGPLHQVVLHGIACAAYILALLMFPTPSWDGLPGARPVRGGLAVVGGVTFVLVGLGTALLPHTTSCVVFFGFLVPVVGLVVLPRRVRRGPGGEARAQARLLFSMLVGSFAVAAVLGIVTLLLNVLSDAPRLELVDPTAHGTPGADEPIALLFWFSRLASAAIAVVVLLSTRQDRRWTSERWFSRGLAVSLVMAVGGGAFVVLRVLLAGVVGPAWATAVVTVAVALTLGPLYVRAEQLVDRLLYGTRPAPYRVLADITALSRSTLSPTPGTSSSATAPDLARVAESVALGLGADVCRLTVRRSGLRDRTYEWTDRAGGFGRRGETDGDLLEVPIRNGDEQVGALAVDRQAVSGLNAQRDQLLTDIADALGVVLEASRSGIELERQLRAALAHAEEIAVSRRRTVAEMDSERRRIERDLHDGAQHHLVSLRLTLGLVEHQVATGELDQAREWLQKLTEQLTGAEAVLAATADGVSSLLLAEKGLVAALRTELAAAHPPVGFECGDIPAGRRFPADVEAAVWFCCAEAVGNARKHAAGAAVTVRLAERSGVLTFTVRDEGPGFAGGGADASGGRGMRNMTARVSAVGGHVAVRSAPGAGTTVEGVVRLPREAVPVGAPVVEPVPVPAPAPAAVSEPEPLPEPAAAPEEPVAAAVSEPEPLPEPAAAPEEPVTAGGWGSLTGQVRELVRAACAAYGDGPARCRVDELARRLDEPVRIAVLATVEDARRMLVEALVGTPAVPRRADVSPTVPVRYGFGDERIEAGPDVVLVTLPAPALRAMTLIDVPCSDDLDPAGADDLRALLGVAGGTPLADAFVLLLHYGRPADLALLDLLHTAGHRGAIGVLAATDEVGSLAQRAVREYGDDPRVRRVCHAVVSVAPATGVAAARLGDDEHRWLQRRATADEADPLGVDIARPDGSEPSPVPETEAALLDRLGPLGTRQALRLVRSGAGDTRGTLAAALVRHSGLGDLQELIASRILRRADALRTRSVLAGLDDLLRTAPPAGEGGRQLRYQLEQIRAGAHELREIELLDVLRSGDVHLPDEQLRGAERLLGADGGDVRTRLGLAADATVEQVRSAVARQPAPWRELAANPVTSTRVREAAQVLVRTCEQLAVEVGDDLALPR